MERIKVTDIPIYQKRDHQFSDSDFFCYIDEMWMKLPCDTNVNITSGLLREDKLPAAVNVSTFHISKLSDILVTY